jgi:probable O-glycosylation ligase (exosortase A-associated)
MSLIPSSLSAVSRRWLRADFEYYYDRMLPVILVAAAFLVTAGLTYGMVNFSPALALLGLLAIPAGILLVTRPDLGLLLVVFAIPFENFNEISGKSLSVLKVLSFVVFGAAAIHFFVFRRKDKLVGAPQNWLIALFLMAIILSNFVAIDPAVTQDRTFKMLRALSLYLVAINVIRTQQALKNLTWVFLISGFLCALYGVYGYYFDPASLDIEGRVTGTMADPNEFAAAMVARLPLALYLLQVEKGQFKRLVLMGGIGVIAYGITLAGSRGGLLALGLALALFILLQQRKIVWLIPASFIVAIMLILMPVNMQQRVGLLPSEQDTGPDSSAERRLTYQIFGWELFHQYPILGVGLDGFSEAYAHSEYRFLVVSGEQRLAHNMYLEIGIGTGLIGLIPFALLLAWTLWMGWRLTGHKRRDPFLANISGGLFAGLAGFLFACIFLSEQYEKPLWLLIAMIVIAQQVASASDRQLSALTVTRSPTAPAQAPQSAFLTR